MSVPERPCAAVSLVFQYQTVNGDKRTDKGGKAALFKQGNKLFLLTVKQIATYSDLISTDTMVSVSIPMLRPVRGEKKLTYKNVLKDKDVPEWTEVDVSDEESQIPMDDNKSINLKTHDSIYYLEVTGEAWAASPFYTPLTENTVNISLGDQVRFCTQRRLGTGFLSEYPQWRGIREIEGKSTCYPGKGNEWHVVESGFQVPPTTTKDCKGAQISFCFPGSILGDFCYYPPMFLVDVNIKAASTGWPLVNEQNELVGLISEPAYLIEGSKELCLPGTWVCAVPAGLTLGAPQPSGEQAEVQEQPANPLPKKMNKAKKKGKKKGKKK